MESKTSMPLLFLVALLALSGCRAKEEKNPPPVVRRPVVEPGGRTIVFPDTGMAGYFKAVAVSPGDVRVQLTAPARVVATVAASPEGGGPNVVLFDNPELTAYYAALLQHRMNVHQIASTNLRQRNIELERARDLSAHGVATGRDVLEAQTALVSEQTALANERTALVEQEARLKLAGLNPAALLRAKAGSAWVICDIAENQLGGLAKGTTCQLALPAFPGESFTGRIEDVGEVVDNVTRMVKLRIGVDNPGGRLKAGMFATVQFGLAGGSRLAVPREALVTVEGKDYLFVQQDALRFERRHVQTGSEVDDRVVVLAGLQSGDRVVTEGAMQLKGLSFGY